MVKEKNKQDSLYTFELGATIPTTQYGNLAPIIRTSASSEEEAMQNALDKMQELWNRVCETGRELKIKASKPQDESTSTISSTQSLEVLKSAINNVEVLYDDANHKYYSLDGSQQYIGGSTYAKQYAVDFPLDSMATKMASKFGDEVTAEMIKDMWAINGKVSTTYGTAIHTALELRGKYSLLSDVLKGSQQYVDSKNPLIKSIVDNFFEGRDEEDARYEVFIADDKTLRCGSIDRLLIVDKEMKIVRIQDFKTNNEIHKSKKIKEPFASLVDKTELGYYWIQLSFYASIMEQYGYTVEGLDIFWLNPNDNEWATYSHDVLEIV